MKQPKPMTQDEELAEAQSAAEAEVFPEDEGNDAEAKAIEAEEALKELKRSFVNRLDKELQRRIGRREDQERRWLEDIRQYHGQYDPDVLAKLIDEDKSRLFINVTRPKTNTGSAKIYDMLYPTDDRNWGIAPTPVPEMAQAIEEGDAQARQITEQANQMIEQGDTQGADELVKQADGPAAAAIQARKAMEAATRKARAMELEMDDQFRECGYNIESRDAIDDGCILGTGIMKGPVMPNRPTGRWKTMAGVDGQEVQVWDQTGPIKPVYYRTDPWHFFPDPDAQVIGKSNGTYERHPLNESELRQLARVDGFDKEAIARLLKNKATATAPNFYAALRGITGIGQDNANDLYYVYEYYGPVPVSDLRQIATALGAEDMATDYEDTDDLEEINMCIWFCQDEVLKFVEHPMDSGDSVYSVWCWQKDPTSIFGYGIPRTMRDSQKALNAAWRMMMDNAGLSTGPQIFMAQSSIEPADGSWDLKPRKFWYITKPLQIGERVVDIVEIPSRQPELMAIITLVRQMIDDETGISQLAQGEQGAGITKTAQGMSILMNSNNVIFRRVIRNWDDDMTTPNVRRAYHWNMQFNPKQSIKGDYEVVARGSSVLLVREMQASSLMALTMQVAGHPRLDALTKLPDLYRKAVQANQIPADEVVLTDDEVEKMEAEQANQPPPPDIEMQKLELQMQIAQMENETKMQIAQLDHQRAMMSLAEARNMSLDKINADLEKVRISSDSSERKLAVEVAMREATGKSAGGSV